jgi:hypothetical protein
MVKVNSELAHRLVFDYEKAQCFVTVADRHGVDRRTVKAYVEQHKKHGSLQLERTRQRNKLISPQAAQAAVELLTGGEHGTCHSVAELLHDKGLIDRVVHRTTLAKAAKAAAAAAGILLRVERGRPKRALLPANMASRLGFAEDNKTREWRHVMFTDRKRFYWRYPGSKVLGVRWSLADKPHAAFTASNPKCVNMYAGLTAYGVTKAHIVAGSTGMATTFKTKSGNTARNITTAEYKHVLLETLLPEGNRIFSAKGHSSWVLQQDNDPTHKGGAASALPAFNGQHTTTVELLPNWPANSPDLSPIENLWAIVQRRVEAAGCKTFEEFKETLHKEWHNVSSQLCGKLIGSMHERLVKCIELEGRRTSF